MREARGNKSEVRLEGRARGGGEVWERKNEDFLLLFLLVSIQLLCFVFLKLFIILICTFVYTLYIRTSNFWAEAECSEIF